MGTKVFIEKGKFKLIGDERDIMLPTQYKIAVLEWCRKNSIEVECPITEDHQHIARQYFGVNFWRIRDEQQRTWFILKWA